MNDYAPHSTGPSHVDTPWAPIPGNDPIPGLGTYLTTQVARIAALEAFTGVKTQPKNDSQAAVNNSAVLVNITQLALAISTTSIHIAEWHFKFQSNATANIKFSFNTLPAGCVGFVEMVYTNNAGTLNIGQFSLAALIAGPPGIQGQGATTPVLQTIRVLVQSGGTAGNVTPMFAQNTANGSDTSVMNGSSLEYRTLVA